MIIEIANPSGFCFGVKRAIEMAEENQKHAQITTLGDLIHNEDENERLASLGLKTSHSINELNPSDTILLRSHGESKSVHEKLHSLGLRVLDATCPYVKKLQRTIQLQSQKGSTILLLGDPEHPEIKGAKGWAEGPIHILRSLDQLRCMNFTDASYVLVAQTTFPIEIWKEALLFLNSHKLNITAIHTICSATKDRQNAAKNLAKRCDCVLVVGGIHSSNTDKLFRICSQFNPNVFKIRNKEDLKVLNLQKYGIIGISAGASTPEWVIDELVDALKKVEKE